MSGHGDNLGRDQLRAFVERLERVEEEIGCLNDDKKDIYGEVKAMGFDAKIVKRVLAIRRQDPDKRAEEEAILDTYLHALGMIEEPPEG
ncbi:DUF2312 domain-containing protein [Rhizobium sp. 12,4]|uniref:DUF2312 domain-containing protein n=1 Tax=Rhizobium sp. 12,4 TaxID=3405135 RepID=UPI003D3480ED